MNRHGSPHYPLKIACLPSSTTSAQEKRRVYLGCEPSGAGDPGAACCSTGAGVFVMTELPVLAVDLYASIREVSIKTTAATVVALLRKVDAPVLPNRVWLPPPPKAAPISAPLPVCSSTIMISAMQTMTCMVISMIDIIFSVSICYDFAERFGVQAGTADQGAVHVRHAHQLVDIARFYAPSI